MLLKYCFESPNNWITEYKKSVECNEQQEQNNNILIQRVPQKVFQKNAEKYFRVGNRNKAASIKVVSKNSEEKKK